MIISPLYVNEPFAKFKNHVAATANNILYHRGKITWPVNAVGTAHEVSVPTGNVNQMEEVIGAVMKKMGFRRDGQQGQRAPPSTSTRVARCVNCGSGKHLATDCTKPKVSLDRRPCYECGKPGHIAKDCRSRRSRTRTTTSMEQEPSDDPDFFGCVECSSWPTPSTITMKDFMPTKTKNSFVALESDDKDITEESNSEMSKRCRWTKTGRPLFGENVLF